MKELESRRQFLRRLIEPFNFREGPDPVAKIRTPTERESPLLTRREFIRNSAVSLASAVILPKLGLKSPDQDSARIGSQLSHNEPGHIAIKESPPQVQPKFSQKEPGSARFETVIQSLGIGVTEAGLVSAANFFNLPSEKLLTQGELMLLKRGGDIGQNAFLLTAMPLSEEALFRFLPSKLAGNQLNGLNWEVGVSAALVEAILNLVMAHPRSGQKSVDQIARYQTVLFKNQLRRADVISRGEIVSGNINQIKEASSSIASSRLSLDNKIPYFKFLNGLFFWGIMRSKGYPDTVLAHATINASFFAVGRALNTFH